MVFTILERGRKVLSIDVNKIHSYFDISNATVERLVESINIPLRLIPKRKMLSPYLITLSKKFVELNKSGKFKSRAELARYLNVSGSYVSQLLRASEH